ncbi:hypothetical protein [Knoellia sinensis]|uniref:hypothetical protein n=1 Tax=Knoellia sinensis TaxID=136100 RepID=UPI000AB04375|nr:hypothetical protein [Knoellia sinensis]
MGKHERRTFITPVLKHRLVTGMFALITVLTFTEALEEWEDRLQGPLLLGVGLFLLGATVIVGSMSIGPRPLRSFGAGAWFVVMGAGAALAFAYRGSMGDVGSRGEVALGAMLLLAVTLPFLGLWMMVARPEQNWEKERRLARERGVDPR